MDSRKFSVYNRARESFLSTGVTVIDTTLEPLKALRVMVEGLALNSQTGLWLNPLNDIPKVPRLSPFDLIYLDGEGRVLQGAELMPGVEFPVFKRQAASALVLPLKTMSLSKTLPGDQLIMEVAEEAEEAAEPVSEQGTVAPAGRADTQKNRNGSSHVARLQADDVFRPRGSAVEWTEDLEEEEESAEPEADDTETRTAAASPAIPAPMLQMEAPQVEKASGPGALARSRQGAGRSRQQAAVRQPAIQQVAIQQPGEEEQTEPAVPPKARLNVPLITVGDKQKKPLEPAPISTPSSLGPRGTESTAEGGLKVSGVTPAVADEDLKKQHAAIQRFIEEAKAQARQKKSGITRALRWLTMDPGTDSDRRKSIRRPSPELMAYYAEKGPTQGLNVGNISSTGVYLLTDERWPPGELIPLTLQRKGPPEEISGRRLLVQAGPARWGKDGIGLYFVFPTGVDLRLWEGSPRREVAETEPEYILREFRTARALGFIRRICEPVTGEVERLLEKDLSSYRAASAVEIALKAEALLSRMPNADKMLAHPEIVVRIMELGSWADAELLQRFWAGLLAASCSMDGQDKANSAFIDLLSVLTLVHVRILSGACGRATNVTSELGVVSIYPTYCTADEICKIAGTNDFSKIHRAIALLADLGLLEKSAHSSFVSYSEKAKTTPTPLGLEMFARCGGLRIAPQD